MRCSAWTLLALVVLVAAAPATRPGIAEQSRSLLADWKPRLDAARFQYTISGPFVIAGDGTLAQLAGYRDRTILAAARALNASFFKNEPAEPILILLFEDEAAYRRLCKEWLNDDDVPHYGFFRPRVHIMVMNVGTGTGTLVHELTHALMAPDFPNVPDWFNEGLASLYEQCSLEGDTIRGHENWRLCDLQVAIKANRLRPLTELVKDPKFYAREHLGLNYAQARYVMFYLQEKGLLKDFYSRFRDNAARDPTGIETLQTLLEPQPLDQFEREWRKWVTSLRFEG